MHLILHSGETFWRGDFVWSLRDERKQQTSILPNIMPRGSHQQRSYVSATEKWGTGMSPFLRD